MSLRFRAHVGRQQIRSGVSGNTAAYSRSATTSMKRVIENYTKLIDHIENVTPDILYAALKPTFEKSQVFCPVDSGKMKASGYLEITQRRGHPTVMMGYGKNGRPSYTAAVHENLEWKHKAPTRAKWLQVALAEDEGAIQLSIINRLKAIGF